MENEINSLVVQDNISNEENVKVGAIICNQK